MVKQMTEKNLVRNSASSGLKAPVPNTWYHGVLGVNPDRWVRPHPNYDLLFQQGDDYLMLLQSNLIAARRIAPPPDPNDVLVRAYARLYPDDDDE